jgi:hypothetical protein
MGVDRNSVRAPQLPVGLPVDRMGGWGEWAEAASQAWALMHGCSITNWGRAGRKMTVKNG